MTLCPFQRLGAGRVGQNRGRPMACDDCPLQGSFESSERSSKRIKSGLRKSEQKTESASGNSRPNGMTGPELQQTGSSSSVYSGRCACKASSRSTSQKPPRSSTSRRQESVRSRQPSLLMAGSRFEGPKVTNRNCLSESKIMEDVKPLNLMVNGFRIEGLSGENCSP